MSSDGVNQNMSNIKATFNLAKNFYNDYDLGDIQIKNDPFARYKLPAVPKSMNRNLEVDDSCTNVYYTYR
ncbi:MAG: hypothetical protein Q7U54_07480 [Bacteroidales bacterium]|nr:hypothetical protein [Bacteroidales bacterium]